MTITALLRTDESFVCAVVIVSGEDADVVCDEGGVHVLIDALLDRSTPPEIRHQLANIVGNISLDGTLIT